ncbi:MAG: magnesium transporter CorA family protein [Candidatus Omnitrophota bacterium]
MLKRYQVINEKIVESGEEKSSILVFVKPDESEKRFLIDQLKVDEHTLNSALDPDELSRLEFEANHTAMIFKFPRNYSGKDQFLFKSGTIGAFVFSDMIAIVLAEDIHLFSDGKPVIKITSLHDIILRLLYKSIYHFLEHLKVFNVIADELEQKLSTSMENRYLLNLFTLEKSVVYYLNAINSNGVFTEKLKNNSGKMNFSQEQAELLDDIIVENNQCYKQAEIYSNIFASLMDARASIVNNNLNVLMKTLNIITLSLMVPTLVVSIFSMNVKIPMQEFFHAFSVIMGIAILSVLIFLMLLRKVIDKSVR